MKNFFSSLWVSLNKPDYSMWTILLYIAVYEWTRLAGYYDTGTLAFRTLHGLGFLAVTLAIFMPIAVWGYRARQRLWNVELNKRVQGRQEANNRYRERCVERAYADGKQIGHTLGVADERVEWRKMKESRDLLARLADGLLTRLGEIQDSPTIKYSPKVIEDWRAELKKMADVQ